MKSIYLKSAYRSLIRNKSYTIINIIGLSLGLAACLLIGLYINNELSFDKDIPNGNQIYRLNEYAHYDGTAPKISASIGFPIAPFLKDNHKELASFARLLSYNPVTLEYQGRKIRITQGALTDTNFASIFKIRLLEGDKNNFIRDRNSIVLMQSVARKLFNNVPAVNKTLQIHMQDTVMNVTVSNVMADMPATSHIQVEALLPIPDSYQKGFLSQDYGSMIGPAYITLNNGGNISDLEKRLTATIHTKNPGIDMRLQPLAQVHSHSMDVTNDIFNYRKIDYKYVTIFIVLAIAIFLIGCINFINLTIAIAGYRGKEIALKKIIGARRIHIIAQIFTETFLSVFAALVCSLLIATTFLPYLNKILNRDLSLPNLFNPQIFGIYIIILLVTTLIAGLYPSWLISSAKASKALKTKVLFTGSKTSLRNLLVTGQFVVAIVFVTSLIVILQQLNFLQKKDLGYDYSQVMKVQLDVPTAAKLPVLRNELQKIKGVADITTGFIQLGENENTFGISYIAPNGEKKFVTSSLENAAPNYTDFFKIKIIEGQNFDKVHPRNQYLINETLAKQIGYDNPVGKQIHLSFLPAGIIKGVVKDFNYSSLYKKVGPLLISSVDSIPYWKTQLYVKIVSTDMPTSVKQIQKVLQTVSGSDEVSYQFMDEHFKVVYNNERQASTMIAVIGGLTIFIACMGLFGLSAFVALRRSKEISIRKVLGASVMQVTADLSKEFLLVIIIAIAIGAPVASLMMDKWLQNFAYRIPIHWWVFAISAGIAILIAAVAVSFQSVKAAMADPVKGLRSE